MGDKCTTIASLPQTIERKCVKKPQLKETTVSVRLAPSLSRTFTSLAAKYGGRSEVVRELIAAFCENRLTITPKIEGTLYDLGK